LTELIFGGVEIPSNRTLLERNNVDNVMLNYWGLRKRGLPKTKPYLIGEHFFPYMKVWVDSGAVQADKANLSIQELEEYSADYEEFIALNYDRIEGFVEFDSQVLGLPRIQQNRMVYENDPKLWVVWHESYGQMLLQRWASEYQNVAIPYDTVESSLSLASATRSLQAKYNVTFHALAVAKPDNLRQIPFASATTLSWLSPMRRGETIIWDGTKLVRYPKKMKAQARVRYKSQVTSAGLDFDKFVSDDTLEATKVAIWSYLQLEKMMSKDRSKSNDGKVSDNSEDTLYTGLMNLGLNASDNSGSEVQRTAPNEVVKRDPQEVTNLPVFGYQMKTIVDSDENGNDILAQVSVPHSTGVSMRQCNTCFVSANCPAFKPDNECAYSFPVEVKTREQLKALLTAIIEMQAERVGFMRFTEELSGGYADPNTSQEMDRLFKLVKAVKELEENKEFIRITAERQSSGGVLSAIFGDRAQALREMEQPLNEDQTTMIIRQSIED